MTTQRTIQYTAVTTVLKGGSWMRPETRAAHLIRVGFKCAFCGCSIKGRKKAHMAHVITPRCKGGDNSPENVIALCPDCNMVMGDNTLAEICAVRKNGQALWERVTGLLALPLDRKAGKAMAEQAKQDRIDAGKSRSKKAARKAA